MYGAGDTPMTDDSESEEEREESGARGGGQNGVGFTETVMDENENDDDDIDNINEDNWIEIECENQLFRVPLSDSVRTFGDIKRYLVANAGQFELTSSHYIVDKETDHEYQDDDDAMIANRKQLLVRWNAFFITIVDGADFSEEIRVAEDFTIQRIKEQVEKNGNARLEALSKDGLELQNDKSLREYNICDNGHTLISRIQISIQDRECDLQTDILVCEFWSIEDVLAVYLQSSRREKHQNATLSNNDEPLDFASTVFDEEIANNCQLQYRVGKYKVLVYDSEDGQTGNGDQQCQEIEVMDNQTVTEIQEYYARLTRKPFMKNDKLLSNERQLEFNVPLYKLRLKDNEPLIIEREQQMKPAQYICAECGAIVSLRPYDAVQCRECFMNVVYKMRTNRVCQYNCR